MPDSAARSAFPKILKMYMDRDNLSQKDIADRLHISKQIVSEYVSGKKFPRVDKMQQLADLFGVLMSDMYNPSKLIDGTDETAPDSSLMIKEEDEIRLIYAYRGATASAREIALETLENHQEKKDSSAVQMA
jgi:transcriptional regulator with XRE-family HTH domain